MKTKIFNKIIVPVDGSQQANKAAEKAFFIGKKLDIKIFAIFVSTFDFFPGNYTPEHTYEIWKEAIEKEGKEILKNLEKKAKKIHVKIETKMLEGKPEEVIINAAKKNDLIVMGSKGKSALDRILLGSVSEKVLHHSSSCVLIVR